MAQNGSTLDAKAIQELNDCANRIRINSVEITNASKSGHPTSSASMAEIMAVLFFNEMRYDPNHPKDVSSDRLVLSKGHACPGLYSAWHETGHLSKEQIMSLRKIDSDIEGHPTPRLDFIDVATGSLGQGLGAAAGMAYTGKHFDKSVYRVYCVLGDGEAQEGSVWEAASFASHYKLDNLVAIVDVNRLGQSEPTMLGHHTDVYAKRFEAFGWHSIVVDGHDVQSLTNALGTAKRMKDKPTAIIAKTFKGAGLGEASDKENWHGKAMGEVGVKAIEELNKKIQNHEKMTLPIPAPPGDVKMMKLPAPHLETPPSYKLGDKVATRKAYGTALTKLGKSNPKIISLDGDTKNSTHAEDFKKEFPDRFIECFIAEQNIISVAVGCQARQRTIPFCSTFAAFFTRAADQLRMAAVSMANIKCVGSHVGVSIGEDGPSQMGLEDLALFRSIHGSTVFYPSDAVSCERAVELAANVYGVCFVRTSRPALQTIYNSDEHFEVGKAKVVRQNDADRVLVIGAGVTLIEALKAADELAKENIHICVLDPFTIKPIDVETIRQQVTRVKGKIVTVEDHYPEGGIGEAVAAVLSDSTWANKPTICHTRLAVTELPRSGPPDDLVEMFGISSKSIVKAVKDLNKCCA